MFFQEKAEGDNRIERRKKWVNLYSACVKTDWRIFGWGIFGNRSENSGKHEVRIEKNKKQSDGKIKHILRYIEIPGKIEDKMKALESFVESF